MLLADKIFRGLRYFIFLISFLHLTSSYAEKVEGIPSGTFCEDQIRNVLNSWNVRSSWERLISIEGKDRFLSSISDRFGQWAYLEIEQRNSTVVTLSKQSQTSINKVTFRSGCSPQKADHISTPIQNRFTDHDLAKLIKKEKDFLIYIWAPEMPLSLSGLTEVTFYAKSQNLPLHVFLYNGSSEQYAKMSGRGHRFPASYYKKIDSFDLRMRGISAHQPVVVRFKNGFITGRLLFGYKSRDEYEKIYKEVIK